MDCITAPMPKAAQSVTADTRSVNFRSMSDSRCTGYNGFMSPDLGVAEARVGSLYDVIVAGPIQASRP